MYILYVHSHTYGGLLRGCSYQHVNGAIHLVASGNINFTAGYNYLSLYNTTHQYQLPLTFSMYTNTSKVHIPNNAHCIDYNIAMKSVLYKKLSTTKTTVNAIKVDYLRYPSIRMRDNRCTLQRHSQRILITFRR